LSSSSSLLLLLLLLLLSSVSHCDGGAFAARCVRARGRAFAALEDRARGRAFAALEARARGRAFATRVLSLCDVYVDAVLAFDFGAIRILDAGAIFDFNFALAFAGDVDVRVWRTLPFLVFVARIISRHNVCLRFRQLHSSDPWVTT